MKNDFILSEIGRFIIVLFLIFIFIVPTYLRATEKDLYDFLWLDQDKKVYVLQNKNYKKKNSFYFDAGYTKVINQKFISGKALALRTGFYFHEEWGVELLYNTYFNTNNDTFAAVQRVNGSVPFVRKLTGSYAGLLVWSPFYGKINTFNKIYYFDWSFGLGLGNADFENNLISAGDENVPDSYDKKSSMAIMAKTNLKFHISKHIHLNIEYLNTSYKDRSPSSPKEERRYNSDVTVGLGFSF